MPAGKPAPDVYLLACRHLGVEAKDCVAIVDSPHGLAAALAAGMQVLWVTDREDVAGEGVRKVKTLADLGEGDWNAILNGDARITVP